ncbi:adenosylcobinamide-phosphate synthase CbiB [Moritella viscosa]|nr:adenosylcobinamide-phosphate synthase CbiB [Moritella viscosa]SGY97713.1 Putative cobalamin biosynthesis protein D [Moritella viscosa]
MNDYMSVSLILAAAFILDILLGEPHRYHPLVGFGNITNKLERLLNKKSNNKSNKPWQARLLGTFSWALLTLPLPLGYYLLHQDTFLFWCLDAVIVYSAIGYNSLVKHAKQIAVPLNNGDIQQARHFCSYIVSRDTSNLTEQEIARATTESVLENGHDAVIASLVWFAIGGAPLVILHRLVNTLDAMWGYKNPQFLYFGWCAARMDDLLGWPTAKISSLLYATQALLTRHTSMFNALRNGLCQGRQYKSLNGGWAMATGATVLNISLGGQGIYHGKIIESVTLGQGPQVNTADIEPSLHLVRNAAIIFIISYFFISLITHM